MLSRITLFGFALTSLYTNAQYKNDNIKFKTVFLEDLCNTLHNNAGYVLLDVRSRREFGDSSPAVTYNIGRLKNSVNIDVSELPKRLNELKAVKDKPVFVYCSHSARSRVASALLADSGFNKVFNINGGMTGFNLLKTNLVPCETELFETANKFTLLSPQDVVTIIKKNKDVSLIDIRSDSVFKGISSAERYNANGHITGAINIPLADLAASLQKIPPNRKIIIIDDTGEDCRKAAALFIQNGYKGINILFNGMLAWAGVWTGEFPDKEKYWQHQTAYTLIQADDFDLLARKEKNLHIIDVRTVAEFTNKATPDWYNRGNIKGALNIPLADLNSRIKELEGFRDQPIVIYSRAGEESCRAGKQLALVGFKNVMVLIGGIETLRWRAANIKGKTQFNDWVENYPVNNL